MTYFDRENPVRILGISLLRAAVRFLFVALIPALLVVSWLLFTVGATELAALVDWGLIARVLVLVGKIVVSTPARVLVA